MREYPVFVIFARVIKNFHSFQKPIHISINNSFPSINLHLGIFEDEENLMQMLIDTGSAMNEGILIYYLW